MFNDDGSLMTFTTATINNNKNVIASLWKLKKKQNKKNREHCEYDDCTAKQRWLNCGELRCVDYDLTQSREQNE